MRVLCTLCIAVLLVAACSGDGSSEPPAPPGPPHKQVILDWEQYQNGPLMDNGCKAAVEFTGAKVIGTSVEGNKATVLVEISGNWKKGGRNLGWFAGPCVGFSSRNGDGQKVVQRAVYEKFDTGWRARGSSTGRLFSRER